MFGLPDGVKACLFDLDGVVTQTAVVHAAAWKEMFDEFLRARAESTGTGSCRSTRTPTTTRYVDGKPRLDGTRSFLESRGIELPEGEPDDPPGRAHDLRPEQPQERPRAGEDRRGALRSTTDRSPTSGRCGRRGCAPRSCRPAPTPCRSSMRPGIADLSTCGSTAWSPSERDLRGQAGPDTFLAGAAELGVAARQAAVFEDALAGVEAGRAGTSGSWWASTGSARPTSCPSTAPTSWSRTSRSSWSKERRDDRRTSAVPGRALASGARQRLDLDVLAQSESVFALSNGHIGLRGNLDEGEPHGLPGTYLNSVYELRPLPYAEAGYGYPESGQTVINVTNGKLIRLLVDDEPFDVRYGTLHSHERVLDLRAGHADPRGRVALAGRRQGAGHVRADGLADPARDRRHPLRRSSRRRAAAARACSPSWSRTRRCRRWARTRAARRRPGVAAGQRGARAQRRRPARVTGAPDPGQRPAGRRPAMAHAVDRPGDDVDRIESTPTWAGSPWRASLPPGERLQHRQVHRLRLVGQRSRPALHDQVVAALAAAQLTGWDGLLAEQRAYLDEFWDGADVEVDGDAEIQQAVRFGLFHILQAGGAGRAPADRRRRA